MSTLYRSVIGQMLRASSRLRCKVLSFSCRVKCCLNQHRTNNACGQAGIHKVMLNFILRALLSAKKSFSGRLSVAVEALNLKRASLLSASISSVLQYGKYKSFDSDSAMVPPLRLRHHDICSAGNEMVRFKKMACRRCHSCCRSGRIMKWVMTHETKRRQMFSVGSTIALSFAAEYGLGSPLRDTILSSNGAPKLEKVSLCIFQFCCLSEKIALTRNGLGYIRRRNSSHSFHSLLQTHCHRAAAHPFRISESYQVECCVWHSTLSGRYYQRADGELSMPRSLHLEPVFREVYRPRRFRL